MKGIINWGAGVGLGFIFGLILDNIPLGIGAGVACGLAGSSYAEAKRRREKNNND